ncbi:LCP family protein [Nocardioides euryhalodurans]|uniref:LytR family transcriptional regulator n=1 Tax=Nocardioides euryhalodurans TaxID=2518370 RepID=A0A4P7GIF8_9ACTN|nr:LCP family protein [Nocardioides euryhalodurans]QBR91740.1 LytR family transcriptional regulator [Nocardioides euryhalodurans]
MTGRRLTRTLRAGLLALVLGVVALAVPDSAVRPAEVSLVDVSTAEGVDLGDDVIWILAVGSDARPGQLMTRSRGDAIQMVGINTRTGAASAIGVPRDSWVPIPGYGSNRVNAGLYFGGPSLMARTVGNLVGVQPDYVFVTRFPFFENMVNSIGGIYVDNPRRFSDPYLKPEGFKAGRIKLDGYGAMAFSRIRKGLAGGDFDRSANQQRTLRGIQSRIRGRADEPGFIERGVLTVMRNTQTNLSPARLFELAQAVAQVKPSKIRSCVVDGRIGTVGGASIVFPDVSQARRYGNAARSDATLGPC